MSSHPSDTSSDDPGVFLTRDDGTRIFTRAWLPAGDPRAVLVIMHGFKAHSGQYQWVGEQLAARGHAVHAMDMRGHGRSSGDRYWVEQFTDYVDDLAAFVASARARHPGRPVFLLGHSAGGVISCHYALDHGRELAGFICESFAFRLPINGFLRAVIRGLDHVAPHLNLIALADKDFSRDPAVVAAMAADPLINHEPGPAHTGAVLLRADAELLARMPEFTVPMLIIHGTADKATLPVGSETLQDRSGSADKTLKLYDETFHDPLHDINKAQVLADIVAWMEARM